MFTWLWWTGAVRLATLILAPTWLFSSTCVFPVHKNRMCVSVLTGPRRASAAVSFPSVCLRMIDRHPFSGMPIGSDLKQVLLFLTVWLSFIWFPPQPPQPSRPPLQSTRHLPCSLKRKGEKGTEHGGSWVKTRVIVVWGKGNCRPRVWARVLKWDGMRASWRLKVGYVPLGGKKNPKHWRPALFVP